MFIWYFVIIINILISIQNNQEIFINNKNSYFNSDIPPNGLFFILDNFFLSMNNDFNRIFSFSLLVSAETFTAPSNQTLSPTNSPIKSPTKKPTKSPTKNPSVSPTENPSKAPSKSPSVLPSTSPTSNPTVSPSTSPSLSPTLMPTESPTWQPTTQPTISPTHVPTAQPTKMPTITPTKAPSLSPSISPTKSPTRIKIVENDVKAWHKFYDSLGGSAWAKCSDSRDYPCGCSYPEQKVVCELITSHGRSLSSGQELTIVSISLRNNKLKGIIASDTIKLFSSLRSLDLSCDPGKENANIIVPSPNTDGTPNSCANIDECSDSKVLCSLTGSGTSICSNFPVGMVVAIVVSSIVLILLSIAGFLYRRHYKRRHNRVYKSKYQSTKSAKQEKSMSEESLPRPGTIPRASTTKSAISSLSNSSLLTTKSAKSSKSIRLAAPGGFKTLAEASSQGRAMTVSSTTAPEEPQIYNPNPVFIRDRHEASTKVNYRQERVTTESNFGAAKKQKRKSSIIQVADTISNWRDRWLGVMQNAGEQNQEGDTEGVEGDDVRDDDAAAHVYNDDDVEEYGDVNSKVNNQT